MSFKLKDDGLPGGKGKPGGRGFVPPPPNPPPRNGGGQTGNPFNS
ncbi:hypothetical protein DFA_05239 [Cavenderia fasciculata]|uniref:Uncharacterized protein n=1 Tax=Cavenderia fasciculata TaxID=261658 RepID=F4PNQ6_CACFS|nr:uncharacterized protein DFA_05239 [Cavenderia fasciculata]EGG23109.1 hypothetical protein DFA_05239 [Cavenderia fasciculata]|eukprot:XP_004360960.1 hypothetical protein DFA_05239 [Cavenderia fasciculata]